MDGEDSGDRSAAISQHSNGISQNFRFKLVRHWIWFVLLAAALIIILVALLSQGVEYDEAITLLQLAGNSSPQWPDKVTTAQELGRVLGGMASFHDLMASLAENDVHPPLFYAVSWALKPVLGAGVVGYRLLSFGMVLASTAVLWPIWRRLSHRDSSRALLYSAFFLASPFVFYMATTARNYSLATAMLVVALAISLRLLRRTDHFSALALGIVAGLAVFSNYLALFIAGFLVITVLTVLIARRNWIDCALLVAGFLVVLFFTGLFLVNQIDARPDQQSGFPGAVNFFAMLIILLFSDIPNEYDANIVPIFFLVVLMAAALLGAAFRLWISKEKELLLIFGCVVAHVIGLTLLSLTFDKNLGLSKYLVPAAPFLTTTIAAGALWFIGRSKLTAYLFFLPVLWLGATGTVAFSFTSEVIWASARQAAIPLDEQTLVIVDRGFGRGDVAVVVQAVAPEQKMFVARLVQITDLAPADPNLWERVHVIYSWADFLAAREKVRSVLKRRGWRRVAADKLFETYEPAGLDADSARRPGRG